MEYFVLEKDKLLIEISKLTLFRLLEISKDKRIPAPKSFKEIQFQQKSKTKKSPLFLFSWNFIYLIKTFYFSQRALTFFRVIFN